MCKIQTLNRRLFMRSFQLAVATFFCSLFCLSAVSADNFEAKVYIPKEAIEFTDDGVLVYVNDECIALDGVYVDQCGYFSCDEELIAKMPKKDCNRDKEHQKYDAWMDYGFGGCPECRKSDRQSSNKTRSSRH